MSAKIKKRNELDNRLGKRRLISSEECLFELEEALPKFFTAFNRAVEKYNKVSAMFSIESKSRFDAAVLNTALVESLQLEFRDNWRWGKYKRFILRLNGYIFLVKKLKKNNKPMNVKTELVNSISNQMNLSLFDNDVYREDPILFFGYKIDKMGEIFSPQIVYIDEDKVKWIITENDITFVSESKDVQIGGNKEKAKASLRNKMVSKKASNQ